MKPYVAIAASFAALAPIQAQAQPTTIKFAMTVSPGASSCLPNAAGTVYDHSFGEFENLEVIVKRLPPNTDFDLFSIEVPNAPFGLAWYIGDINTDSNGVGVRQFRRPVQCRDFRYFPGHPNDAAAQRVF
jgi:hypothetical protein